MIRKATEADLDRIMDLIVRVVRGMRAEGIDQWNDDYPVRSDFRADILAGELYLDESDDESPMLRGVVCINQAEPEEYRSAAWSMEGPALENFEKWLMPLSLRERAQKISTQYFLTRTTTVIWICTSLPVDMSL